MCQESLINYLDMALNSSTETIGHERRKQAQFGDEKAEQGLLTTATRDEIVPRADIATFVHLGDQIAHYEAVETRYTIKMPTSIEKHARLIDEKLADITICDPAVGSGAFPVGMMGEIVRARSALTYKLREDIERANVSASEKQAHLKELTSTHSAYGLKKHAIQSSLYGVDIDPGAVEIAKLRLWLSLVVDEEDVKQIKPLPNLFYKVVTGDSLLRVEKTLFNEKLFQRIEQLKPMYFEESHTAKKQLFRQQIDELIHQLTNDHETFDFEIYFSEVFHRNRGFDVVIGNPPWVSNDSIDEQRKTKLRSLFSYSVQSRFDLSCPFVELSLERLMGKHACAALVLPEHLWIGEYFIDFRKHTYKHWREVTSLKEGYFDDVNNPASMLLMGNGFPDLVIGKSLPEKTIERRTQSKAFLEEEVQLGSRGQEIRPFKVFFDLDYLTLKARISRSGKCVFLDKMCVVTDGVQTANVLNEIMTDKTPRDRARYHKALRKGKSIPSRYGHLVWDGWWMLKPEFASAFKRPGLSYDSPKRMLCFEAEEKIVMRQTEPTIMATLDRQRFFFPNSIFQCIVKDQFKRDVSLSYVLGLLNSALIRQVLFTRIAG